jgi:predicted nucleotidyltransferase
LTGLRQQGCLIDTKAIVTRVRNAFPDVQAVYLFGSCAEGSFWPTSDVDIALLLPHEIAKRISSLYMTDVHAELERLLSRDVDLINLRQVSTVLQKEVIIKGQRLDCQDPLAADEFEMLVLSFYQKLNEERQGIMEEFRKTKRAYPV